MLFWMVERSEKRSFPITTPGNKIYAVLEVSALVQYQFQLKKIVAHVQVAIRASKAVTNLSLNCRTDPYDMR